MQRGERVERVEKVKERRKRGQERGLGGRRRGVGCFCAQKVHRGITEREGGKCVRWCRVSFFFRVSVTVTHQYTQPPLGKGVKRKRKRE